MNRILKKPVELVVVSGKGGTGKTTVSASFAALAEDAVAADCDVDASNMALLLEHTERSRESFVSGRQASISQSLCIGCGRCARICRFGAIQPVAAPGRRKFSTSEDCEGCGLCVEVCPRNAIMMHPVDGGDLFVSDAFCGPLVHARLKPGLGNSGKLATLVRNRARDTARESGRERIIIDGPPGVGCPTIASLSGATRVLVVTEPTLSGEHDMLRVIELCGHFKLPVHVCVNKADINRRIADSIRSHAAGMGAAFAGEIPFDEEIVRSTRRGSPVVRSATGSPAARAIRNIWESVKDLDF